MYQTKKITYSQNSKEDLFRCTILCLLFPPFISSIFAFYKFLHYKSRSFGILFFVFFAHNYYVSTEAANSEPKVRRQRIIKPIPKQRRKFPIALTSYEVFATNVVAL